MGYINHIIIIGDSLKNCSFINANYLAMSDDLIIIATKLLNMSGIRCLIFTIFEIYFWKTPLHVGKKNHPLLRIIFFTP